MTRRRKKHRPDEIVAKLRDADAMLNAGKVRRRVCGFRLGQGLGSSRTRWPPWSALFPNPHIASYMKSNPVTLFPETSGTTCPPE